MQIKEPPLSLSPLNSASSASVSVRVRPSASGLNEKISSFPLFSFGTLPLSHSLSLSLSLPVSLSPPLPLSLTHCARRTNDVFSTHLALSPSLPPSFAHVRDQMSSGRRELVAPLLSPLSSLSSLHFSLSIPQIQLQKRCLSRPRDAAAALPTCAPGRKEGREGPMMPSHQGYWLRWRRRRRLQTDQKTNDEKRKNCRRRRREREKTEGEAISSSELHAPVACTNITCLLTSGNGCPLWRY